MVAQQAVVGLLRSVPHPAQRALERRAQVDDVGGVETPAPGVVEQADPQRRGVDGAVVDRRQGEVAGVLEDGAPHLVQDLARLLRGADVD